MGVISTNGNHTHGYKTWVEMQKFDGQKYDGRLAGENHPQTDSAGDHSHTLSINATGGNAAHNTMPPYQVVYRWLRSI